MKLVVLAVLVVIATSLTVEVSNIHNGYRNVYRGKGVMKSELFHLIDFVYIYLINRSSIRQN